MAFDVLAHSASIFLLTYLRARRRGCPGFHPYMPLLHVSRNGNQVESRYEIGSYHMSLETMQWCVALALTSRLHSSAKHSQNKL